MVDDSGDDVEFTCLSVLDTVRYQVVEQDAQPLIVDFDLVRAQVVVKLNIIFNLPVLHIFSEDVDDALNDFSQLNILEVWLEFANLDFAHLNEIVGCKH